MLLFFVKPLTWYKTVSDPLKEGHHFDQSLGGVAGLFENIRSNTQVQSFYSLPRAIR